MTVYVIQRPARYDRASNSWVNKYDISAAEEYGEMKYLLQPGNVQPVNLEATIDYLLEELSEYNDNDHLLAIGDPVAMVAAGIAAAKANDGKISILKFDRMSGKYHPYPIDVGTMVS